MHALFINGQAGRLFAVYWPAAQATGKALLHVPAFAEEMNCARHAVAVQAQAFAEQGWSVLVVDVFGSGDSAGEFEAARWQTWRDDIVSAYQWLQQQGADNIALWGLRGGALLALDLIHHQQLPVSPLLLWQPVLSGRQWLQQWLRLRVTSGRFNGTATETVAGLLQRLDEGETLEIAGYALSPALSAALLRLDAVQQLPPPSCAVAVVSLVSHANMPLPATYADYLQRLPLGSQHTTVIGDAFWAGPAPINAALMAASLQQVAAW